MITRNRIRDLSFQLVTFLSVIEANATSLNEGGITAPISRTHLTRIKVKSDRGAVYHARRR